MLIFFKPILTDKGTIIIQDKVALFLSFSYHQEACLIICTDAFYPERAAGSEGYRD